MWPPPENKTPEQQFFEYVFAAVMIGIVLWGVGISIWIVCGVIAAFF